MPANGTYLGIDYGTKHLGVAVGQSITQTATALTTLAANRADFWSQLSNLITSWQPVGLVIGLPLNMDLTHQKTTTLVQQFARACEKKFKLPIYWMDERLTTRTVKDEWVANQGSRSLDKKTLDALAARLILQDWLQSTSFEAT